MSQIAEAAPDPFRLTSKRIAPSLPRTAVAYVADSRYLPLALASAASAKPKLSLPLPVYLFLVDVPEATGRAACDYLRGIGIEAEALALDLSGTGTDLSVMPIPREGISPAAYGRLAVPDLLPDVKTLIYLDGDTLIDDDLAELALCCARPFAAVESLRTPGSVPGVYALNDLEPANSYFNSGVCVIDADFWRREKLTARAVELAADASLKTTLRDQDVLNLIFGQTYHRLHPRWNFTKGNSWRYPHMRPAIAHFAGRIFPWDPTDRRCPQVYRDRYIKLFAEMPPEITQNLDHLMMPKQEQDRARNWWPFLERTGIRRKSGWNPAHAEMLETFG